jgi:hypothetical protein
MVGITVLISSFLISTSYTCKFEKGAGVTQTEKGLFSDGKSLEVGESRPADSNSFKFIVFDEYAQYSDSSGFNSKYFKISDDTFVEVSLSGTHFWKIYPSTDLGPVLVHLRSTNLSGLNANIFTYRCK